MAKRFLKWTILGTCSIDSGTNNLEYVEDVKNCDKNEELTVLTIGGSLLFDLKGRLTILSLNVNPKDNYLATTISLKDANKIPGMRVTMDASIDKAMNMILRYGTVFK